MQRERLDRLGFARFFNRAGSAPSVVTATFVSFMRFFARVSADGFFTRSFARQRFASDGAADSLVFVRYFSRVHYSPQPVQHANGTWGWTKAFFARNVVYASPTEWFARGVAAKQEAFARYFTRLTFDDADTFVRNKFNGQKPAEPEFFARFVNSKEYDDSIIVVFQRFFVRATFARGQGLVRSCLCAPIAAASTSNGRVPRLPFCIYRCHCSPAIS